MIPITLLKWDWATLWIGLSRFSTHYSHIVDGSLVVYVVKNKITKKTWEWECGSEPQLIKNCTSLSLLIKDYMHYKKKVK